MMIVKLVRENPGISIDRIQAEMAWREGLTPSRVSEYVTTLVTVGQIKDDGKGFSAVRPT